SPLRSVEAFIIGDFFPCVEWFGVAHADLGVAVMTILDLLSRTLHLSDKIICAIMQAGVTPVVLTRCRSGFSHLRYGNIDNVTHTHGPSLDEAPPVRMP